MNMDVTAPITYDPGSAAVVVPAIVPVSAAPALTPTAETRKERLILRARSWIGARK
ncbi:MAG: hypothetical protein NVSMB5_25210 [Candidatus Velthaea sp.]